MSINLHCNKMELLQTPTYITHMCLSKPDDNMDIFYKYSLWCKSLLNGSYKNIEDLEEKNKHITFHLSNLKRMINDEDIKFYAL